MSTISWSWPWAFLMFPLVIGINVLLIILKQTNTFNADLWNVWGKIFTAVAVYYITDSVAFAFVIAGVQAIFELKSADFHQYRVEKMSGIPGVTITHKMVFLAAPMYPVDWLLQQDPGAEQILQRADLREKVGLFAENHILGFILGIVFELLARFSVAETLTLGIQATTALTLFPVISKYFVQALEPISAAVSAFMHKRFGDRQPVRRSGLAVPGRRQRDHLAGRDLDRPRHPAVRLHPPRERHPSLRWHHQHRHRGSGVLRLPREHHPDADRLHDLRAGVPLGGHGPWPPS